MVVQRDWAESVLTKTSENAGKHPGKCMISFDLSAGEIEVSNLSYLDYTNDSSVVPVPVCDVLAHDMVLHTVKHNNTLVQTDSILKGSTNSSNENHCCCLPLCCLKSKKKVAPSMYTRS